MEISAPARGVHIPLITPFTGTGEIALDALERLAHELLDEGAAGLVALGTTAEVATLTAEEKQSVVDVVAGVCRERDAPLIVGAGSNDTAASREALAALRKVPEAVAALTLVPHFTRPGEAGVIAHFTELAADSPVPLVIYHVPYRTGQELGAETLRKLGALPGVVGVKYATGAISASTADLMADPPDGFAVLAGDDVLLSPLLAMGAHGGILASAHLATARFAELVRLWHAGDAAHEGGTAHARDLGHRLAALSAALFAEPNPTVIKGVLHTQGRIPSPAVRLPLLPAGSESVSAALRVLDSLTREPYHPTSGGYEK
ncbi:dihydrodipicolinate synthase family protein [Sphaerimonospora thailandensis]|uniref:4-hydroxy-tetrahydrodipicolinate synthase n=1 Tax=Sphaerimonospora thailandensis TaxID=795644 RepID=A0A8J3RDJ8_9ACTN|nr:dihydrodipicolinate synthase family protein [Sphaerimonospora thailandensis]GIH72790.1 4-hydroxy-tetrahydrodipicolinate synthase [Sphaerimonospora thailandensis]